MICSHCKSDIDNDSLHCDQCGKELFICSGCGKPGKGKNCVECGSPLFSPKQKASGGAAVAPQAAAPAVNSLFGSAPAAPQPLSAPQPFMQPAMQPTMPPQPVMMQQQVAFNAPALPALRIANNHLNIDIDIKDGTIIGRSMGDYVQFFSQFSQISGKHLQFIFDGNVGWVVKDLGSTNGTAISPDANWMQSAKLPPNIPTPINENKFILIANIEFQIKIIPALSSTPGTQRL